MTFLMYAGFIVSVLTVFFVVLLVIDAMFFMEGRIARRLERKRKEAEAESLRRYHEVQEAVRRRYEVEGIDVGYE